MKKNWKAGWDDCHTIWDARRDYTQPNCDPRDYWPAAQYDLDVSPNFKGSLFVSHLVPLYISSKAKTWVGKATTTVSLK